MKLLLSSPVHFFVKSSFIMMPDRSVQQASPILCICALSTSPWVSHSPPSHRWCPITVSCLSLSLFFFFFGFYAYFILFFNFTILCWFCHISTWICHRYTHVPHPEPSSLLPPHIIPLGHPSAPAPSILYHALNLDWWFVLPVITYDIIHVSMPFSQIIPPSPSLTESKRLLYTSVSLLLSHIQGYCYHLSKLHIYALVYCIGVFLSGLLRSV